MGNKYRTDASVIQRLYLLMVRTCRRRQKIQWVGLAALVLGVSYQLHHEFQSVSPSLFETPDSTGTTDYILWTYPAPLPSSIKWDLVNHVNRCRDSLGKSQCKLLCSYQPCRDFANAHKLTYGDVNLPKLVAKAQAQLPSNKQYRHFQVFLDEHYWFKLQHGTDFPHHVQSIAALSIIFLSQPSCVLIPRDVTRNGLFGLSFLSSRSSLTRICREDVSDQDQRYNPTRVISSALSSSSSVKHQLQQQQLPPFATVGLDFSSSGPHFGILDYSGRVQDEGVANSGDEMQTLPGLQFFPYLTDYVDRDHGLPASTRVDFLFGNAWWGVASEFPPAEKTQMIMTSMHTSAKFLDVVRSNRKYFQRYNREMGPIGARDLKTYQFLKNEQKLTVYKSSCFTQMLGINRPAVNNMPNTTIPTYNQNAHDGKRNLIMVVDADAKFIPASIRDRAKIFSANVDGQKKDSRKARFEHAMSLLRLYKDKAKVVITSRIHSALPASAYGVPVIFMEPKDEKLLPGQGGGRTGGISDLFHHVTYSEKVPTRWDIDVDRLEPNPGVHRQDRYRASFWNYLKTHGPPWYEDTARLFGLLPLQRLGKDVPAEMEKSTSFGKAHNLFHFIHTTPASTLTWRVQRSIEAVFFHHPNAKVIMHSNALPSRGTRLDIFQETGFDFEIRPYPLLKWLKESPSVTAKDIMEFQKILPQRKRAQYWYSHKTDLVRLLILERYGGVYLDTDQHLIRPIPKSFTNVMGYQDKSNERYKDGFVNGAAMIFEKANPFLQGVIKEALNLLIYKYNPEEWSLVGPYLLTDKWKEREEKNWFHLPVQVAEPDVFYPYYWEVTERCFNKKITPGFDPVRNPITNNTYMVHLNTKLTGHLNHTIPETVCDSLFHDYCIFCDEIYTDFTKTTT